jgi:hypothetical protein
LKESAEERKKRLQESWVAFKSKHQPQIRSAFNFQPIKGDFQKNSLAPKKKAQKKLLSKFWVRWRLLDSDELRLAALVQIAGKFNSPVKKNRLNQMRGSFNKKKRKLLKFGNTPKCAVCPNKAMVRHHVIPLNVGGINSPVNLILLCDDCHEEIHPWMRTPENEKLKNRRHFIEVLYDDDQEEDEEPAWNLGKYEASGYCLEDVEKEEEERNYSKGI